MFLSQFVRPNGNGEAANCRTFHRQSQTHVKFNQSCVRSLAPTYSVSRFCSGLQDRMGPGRCLHTATCLDSHCEAPRCLPLITAVWRRKEEKKGEAEKGRQSISSAVRTEETGSGVHFSRLSGFGFDWAGLRRARWIQMLISVGLMGGI